jgi:hypothetical protein
LRASAMTYLPVASLFLRDTSVGNVSVDARPGIGVAS